MEQSSRSNWIRAKSYFPFRSLSRMAVFPCSGKVKNFLKSFHIYKKRLRGTLPIRRFLYQIFCFTNIYMHCLLMNYDLYFI